MPKHNLRKQMLSRRRALSDDDARVAGNMIQQAFLGSPEFAGARTIALYSPLHNEVDTKGVMDKAVDCGKRVLFPAVCGNCLVFRCIGGHASFKSGAFGILEPDEKCSVIPVTEADIVVIPGLVFDLSGKRVGYGKGYYDRALHELEGQGKLAAFCYDFQLIGEIVDEPHDVRMDTIFTEKRVVRPRVSGINHIQGGTRL
jgi:5-formyltetrahydrofolate cyclo-ligase